MHHFARKSFPFVAITVAIAALAWAVSFGTLPPADFVFNNEDDVKSVDPSKSTGMPEHRILSALFEGLLRLMPANRPPDHDGVVPLEIVPGVAQLPDISADGKIYTFHLRADAKWSDGSPVTAEDFVWSWRRTLHPDTASECAYQLHYISGAKAYHESAVKVGDPVEVELADRPDPIQPFPRGTIVRGFLRAIMQPAPPVVAETASEDERSRAEADYRRQWVFVVEELSRGPDGAIKADWKSGGKLRAFTQSPITENRIIQVGPTSFEGPVEVCMHVLPDFETRVGVEAVNSHKLVVRLHSVTPFFSELTTFYSLSPMQRRCVERFGTPDWTKPENIVTNGPFLMQSRRIRDRIRLVKNPLYWDREHVQLNVVDALPIKSRLTSLNMFLTGALDWNHAPPGNMIPYLKDREDYLDGPALITYFYRVNVEREGLRDKRVRQALNLALDKQSICSHVTQAGERPARSFVPTGMHGYIPAQCPDYDPARARELLAAAGFPGGRGFPKLEILYNSDEVHKAIAEVIQQQWKQSLGINIELHGIAWPAYLEQMHKGDFDLCRAGWVPDYTDPNTFLDLFVTGGLQNGTHWGNPEYDRLIAEAGSEPDADKRFEKLRAAESILLDELPVIPIYYYVTKNLVNKRVRGFYPNVNDFYPLYALGVSDLEPAGSTH